MVHAGDTFNIKIRPDVSLYPIDDRSTGITATITNIFNQVSAYQLPAGLTINSVSQGPVNGNVEANPDAGYYVNKANVPHAVISGVGDQPIPGFDPMTLPASQRLAIPGIAPNAFWNTATNRVSTTLLGSGTTSGEYAGGSALQGPTVTINVTSTGFAGNDLPVTLGGQLPGSEPRNYTGTQPGNIPAPDANSHAHEHARGGAVGLDQRHPLRLHRRRHLDRPDLPQHRADLRARRGHQGHGQGGLRARLRDHERLPDRAVVLHRPERDPERDVAAVDAHLRHRHRGAARRSTAPTTSPASR